VEGNRRWGLELRKPGGFLAVLEKAGLLPLRVLLKPLMGRGSRSPKTINMRKISRLVELSPVRPLERLANFIKSSLPNLKAMSQPATIPPI